jgi:hypothetical protein
MHKTTATKEPASMDRSDALKDAIASLLSCTACQTSMRLTSRCPEMRGVLTTYQCPHCLESETVIVKYSATSA